MQQVHTMSAGVRGVFKSDIPEPSYSISVEAKEKLGREGRGESLLNCIIDILDKQGERSFHSGVTNVDAYQRSEDGLRLDYWCDASGHGKIKLGLQAPHRQTGYSPVLVFSFSLESYVPQPWNSDLAQRVRRVCNVVHYIPGDWEERLKERASN